MLDRWTHAWVQAPLKQLAHKLQGRVSSDQVTLTGFVVGICSLPALALHWYIPALVCILINRIMDGLDGALARLNGTTDAGGFLDITLDFVFYAAVVLGFALANPESNALAASFLLFSFLGTCSSFLAFAIMAEKRHIARIQFSNKSLYYLGGLTEGTETILFYTAICLWPQLFSPLALGFGGLCLITAATRIYTGYHTIKTHQREQP